MILSPAALEKHHSILINEIESNNGFIFHNVGDAFCCAFQSSEDAVKAAVEIQKSLANEKWDEAVIKVRIGIHSGNAEWSGKIIWVISHLHELQELCLLLAADRYSFQMIVTISCLLIVCHSR
ncbi:MAG: hypothetical protein IPG02_15620 [Ignavibacteria bacterium]|nr:hypothetical protein [Ignavibacteria bacterium]